MSKLENALKLLNEKNYAYFELGYSQKFKIPTIQKTWNISAYIVKEILSQRDYAINFWNSKCTSKDFPRPYTLNAIGRCGVRPLDEDICYGFKHIAWFSYYEQKCARVCYILSDREFEDSLLKVFSYRLGNYTNVNY